MVRLPSSRLSSAFRARTCRAAWLVLEISALRGLQLAKIPALVWTVLGLDGFDYRRPTVFTPALANLAGSASPQS